MQVCISLQTDNHASTPQLSFLQAGCPSCHPTNSVKRLKESTAQNQQQKRISSEVSVNSLGNPWVSPEEEKEGYSGNDLQKNEGFKPKVKQWGVMDDDGESMEEVLLEGLGESELEISAWLMERSLELISETRGSILKGTICYS